MQVPKCHGGEKQEEQEDQQSGRFRYLIRQSLRSVTRFACSALAHWHEQEARNVNHFDQRRRKRPAGAGGGDSILLLLTRIEVIGLRHFDPCPGILLKLGDCLAAFPDNGTGSHSWHQDLEVIASSISTCKVKKEARERGEKEKRYKGSG